MLVLNVYKKRPAAFIMHGDVRTARAKLSQFKFMGNILFVCVCGLALHWSSGVWLVSLGLDRPLRPFCEVIVRIRIWEGA